MHKKLPAVLTVIALAGAGALVGHNVVSGQSAATETVFIPITPCRLIDTRHAPTLNTGPRSTPVGANEAALFNAYDASDAGSPCAIPASATAVATNTVAINPTARGYLTVYPGDVPNPGTANLNFVAGQAPTPNAANIPLAADGSFNVFNAFGNVDVVIDVNGYFQPSSSAGSQGPAGPAGASGPAGAAGATGPDGPDGPAGATGPAGPTGQVGPAGSNGTAGASGPQGSPGVSGAQFGRWTTSSRVAMTSVNHPTMEVNAFGDPVIAFIDSATHHLRLATCSTATCSSPSFTTLDSSGDAEGPIALAIGHDGGPTVAYTEASAGRLVVVSCPNAACDPLPPPRFVDNTTDSGIFPSMTIGTTGNPIIAYHDNDDLDLEVAACTDPRCVNPPIRTTVDDGGPYTGQGNDITLQPSGNPIISYQGPDDLRVAVCNNSTCSGVNQVTIRSLAPAASPLSSIAIGVDGNPIVSFHDNSTFDLKVAACSTPTCAGTTPATVSTLDTDYAAFSNDIQIGIDGLGLIAYEAGSGATHAVRIFRCADVACTTGVSHVVSNLSSLAYNISMTLGPDANPLVSHSDLITKDFFMSTLAQSSYTFNAWES